jgi:hypothetical protein
VRGVTDGNRAAAALLLRELIHHMGFPTLQPDG